MTLDEIISEADGLVSNEFGNEKFSWLNEVNNRFFEVVKIPKPASFSTVKNQAAYVLTSDIRARNIDQVKIGYQSYPSFLFEDVKPGSVYHLFDDETSTLTLSDAPLQVENGIVRYFRVATSSYTSADGGKSPDAPEEYHFTYVTGLAQKIAAAFEDIAKANNYEVMFNNQLQIAAQNYAKMR